MLAGGKAAVLLDEDFSKRPMRLNADKSLIVWDDDGEEVELSANSLFATAWILL